MIKIIETENGKFQTFYYFNKKELLKNYIIYFLFWIITTLTILNIVTFINNTYK